MPPPPGVSTTCILGMIVPRRRSRCRTARPKPLTQRRGELRLQRARCWSADDAAQRIEPVRIGMMENGAVAAHVRLRLKGHPEVGRRVGDAIAKESGGAMPITVKGRAWIKIVEPTMTGSRQNSPCHAW